MWGSRKTSWDGPANKKVILPKVEQRQSWYFSLFAYDDVSGWLKLICISKVVFITLHVIANLQNTYKLCKGKYHWTDDLLFDWFDFDKQVNKEKEAGIGQIKKALGKLSLFESINRQIGVTLVIQCSMYEAFQSKSSHRKSILGGQHYKTSSAQTSFGDGGNSEPSLRFLY